MIKLCTVPTSNACPFPCFLFGDLPEQELTIIHRHKTTHHYKKKQLIYAQGTPSFGMYCIQSGWVKVYHTSNEGKQHIVRIASPGDVLALPTLFTDQAHFGSAEALEDTSVNFLKHDFVLSILKDHPNTMLRIVKYLVQRLHEAEVERAELAEHSVRERVARLLVLHGQHYGKKEINGIRLQFQLSREELAEMVGTATETLVRFLKEFRDDRIIETQGREVIIIDQKRLLDTAQITHL